MNNKNITSIFYYYFLPCQRADHWPRPRKPILLYIICFASQADHISFGLFKIYLSIYFDIQLILQLLVAFGALL